MACQTLYTWRERGRAVLEQAFAPPAVAALRDVALECLILTLLVEDHRPLRGGSTDAPAPADPAAHASRRLGGGMLAQ